MKPCRQAPFGAVLLLVLSWLAWASMWTTAAAQSLAPMALPDTGVYRLPPVEEVITPEWIPGGLPTPVLQPPATQVADPATAADVPPPPKLWSASFEFGLNGSTGNSEVFTIRFGSNAKRCTDRATLTLDLNYSKGSRAGVLAEHRLLLDGRNEWTFLESSWTPFVKGSLEYDEFRAFDVRLVGNAGMGYQFVKNDVTKLIGRLGAGFSQEIGGPDDDMVPEGLAGAEYERKLSERQSISASTEYFPDVTDPRDFRATNKASWEMLVDPAWNLSLKLSANHRYDSTPHGLKKNDLDYTLLAMWKY